MTSSTTTISAGLAALAGVGVVSALAGSVRRRGKPYLPGSALTLSEWDAHAFRTALRLGFAGIEVPVHLGNGDALRVGSGRDGDSRTGFAKLVLDPLAARSKRSRGRLYPEQTEPLTLLLNLRDPGPDRAARAYQSLSEHLNRYPTLVSRCDHGKVVLAPVTVVLTGGNWTAEQLAGQEQRSAFADGTFADLGRGAPLPVMQPLVSEDWSWRFGWVGEEALPPEERHILRSVVATAHSDGRGVRVLGGPTEDRRVRRVYWLELLAAGVDLISTDQPAELARFLRRVDPAVLAVRDEPAPVVAPPAISARVPVDAGQRPARPRPGPVAAQATATGRAPASGG
jgi:hypothetical protein